MRAWLTLFSPLLSCAATLMLCFPVEPGGRKTECLVKPLSFISDLIISYHPLFPRPPTRPRCSRSARNEHIFPQTPHGQARPKKRKKRPRPPRKVERTMAFLAASSCPVRGRRRSTEHYTPPPGWAGGFCNRSSWAVFLPRGRKRCFYAGAAHGSRDATIDCGWPTCRPASTRVWHLYSKCVTGMCWW